MEPIDCTVIAVTGDYAIVRTDSGIENQVALALLPDGVDTGTRLRFSEFAYHLI